MIMKIHFFNIFILQPTHKDVSLKQFYKTSYFFPKPKKMNKSLKNLQLSDQNAS